MVCVRSESVCAVSRLKRLFSDCALRETVDVCLDDLFLRWREGRLDNFPSEVDAISANAAVDVDATVVLVVVGIVTVAVVNNVVETSSESIMA